MGWLRNLLIAFKFALNSRTELDTSSLSPSGLLAERNSEARREGHRRQEAIIEIRSREIERLDDDHELSHQISEEFKRPLTEWKVSVSMRFAKASSLCFFNDSLSVRNGFVAINPDNLGKWEDEWSEFIDLLNEYYRIYFRRIVERAEEFQERSRRRSLSCNLLKDLRRELNEIIGVIEGEVIPDPEKIQNVAYYRPMSVERGRKVNSSLKAVDAKLKRIAKALEDVYEE